MRHYKLEFKDKNDIEENELGVRSKGDKENIEKAKRDDRRQRNNYDT